MSAHGARLDHPSAATILLVDDERIIRTVLRPLLERSGYQVLEADGGEAAKRIAEQNQPIHLLLTDVMMPVMSGPELVRDLRLRRPDLKVFYMSASSLDDLLSVPHIREHGFGFIQKPFAPVALASWVRGILQPAQKEPGAPIGETECPLETILLIENDPGKLVARSMVLRSFGYTVLEAANRGEAWFACNEHQQPIHLAILDHDNSCEFVTRLQILCPQIRALLISDQASAELADMRCEYAFLQKPFRLDALADAIRELLDGPKKIAATSAG
jgi:CheY-like chemotaxis protein